MINNIDTIKFPDPRLKKKADLVENIDQDTKEIIESMVSTMYRENGIGLAANQIGILKRIIIIDVDYSSSRKSLYKLINPKIIWASEEKVTSQEGCLSLPNVYSYVQRASQILLKYLDENNNYKEINVTGLLSICIQHEIDHLNGILFIDHLSKIKREILLKKEFKQQREGKRIQNSY